MNVINIIEVPGTPNWRVVRRVTVLTLKTRDKNSTEGKQAGWENKSLTKTNSVRDWEPLRLFEKALKIPVMCLDIPTIVSEASIVQAC